jgi:hypothetical protein
MRERVRVWWDSSCWSTTGDTDWRSIIRACMLRLAAFFHVMALFIRSPRMLPPIKIRLSNPSTLVLSCQMLLKKDYDGP